MLQTEPTKKEFHVDAWPEVYASRQTRMVLKWPAVAVEEHVIRVRGENNESQTERVLCLAVQKSTVKGIIPLQESGVDPTDNKYRNRARLLNLIGQEVAFVVTGIDTENNTFLASRKAVMDALSKGTWRDLQPGMVREAVARRLAFRRNKENALVPSGFIAEIDGVEAFLPAWELSHGWVEEVVDLIQPGDRFDVKVKEINPEDERLVVSVKDLIPNPWPDAARRYQVNGYYSGTVTGVVRYGIFVELEPGVNALCRHMRGIPKKGDTVLIVATDVSLNDGVGRIEGRTIRVIRRAS